MVSVEKYLLILEGVSNGLTTEEIAKGIGQSTRTLETNIQHLVKCFKCKNRTHLIATCIREKIIK